VSHVATIKVDVLDLDALRAAVEAMGGEFREGQQTYAWWGTSVGDYPLPAGFAVEDLGKCEHALRFPGAKYEVGVVRRRDGKPGYALLQDFYSTGNLPAVIGESGGKLAQAYSREVVRKAARRAGHSVSESVQADGSIVLRVRAS